MASMVKALITTMAALNGQPIKGNIVSISIESALRRLREEADPTPPPPTYSAAASHITPAPNSEQPRSSTPVTTTPLPPKNQPLRMRNVPDDLEHFIEVLDELPTLNDSQAFPALPSPKSNPRDPRLNKTIE